MEPIVEFILLLTGLFLIPKFFIRYHIPEPISEIFLGVLLGPIVIGVFGKDVIIEIMGTIGIITLFFIAGYEVNIEKLRTKTRTLKENGLIHLVLICILAVLIMLTTKYKWSIGFLIAMALLTPSAGFILSSLKILHLKENIKEWIESKVISAEIFTLLLLLIILNADNPSTLFTVTLGLAFLFFLLPYILAFFFKYIIVRANHADTFFIFLLAILVAYCTHLIGVHYIIGAFFVGLAVNRFRDSKSNTNHINNEKIRDTFISFSSIFVPFYFFSIGLGIESKMISVWSVSIAILLFASIFSAKILISFIHRRLTLRESFRDSIFVALLTTPTLLFTFVIAELIHADISETTYGVLIIYALLSASIPYVANRLLRYIHAHRKI